MDNNNITIENFEELKVKMQTMEFCVEWRVSPDIGPDWIGSDRTIDFYLNDYILSESEFCKSLKDKLIKIIPIPYQSKNHVITGDGDITLENQQLLVHYSWQKAIPYDNSSEYKEDKILFYP
jgi:hypothetical protein